MDHCPESDIGHNWVAGMMYVDVEDIERVAQARQDRGEPMPECEYCETPYVLAPQGPKVVHTGEDYFNV